MTLSDSGRGAAFHGFALGGGGDGGEDQVEGLEIVLGAVFGFALFFDGAEEFAHRPGEAVGKPRALDLEGGGSARSLDFNVMGGADSAVGADGAAGAADTETFLGGVFAVPVEIEHRAAALESSQHRGHHRHPDLLAGRKRTVMLKPGEDNGPRINAAIREMSGQGGGIIELPAGIWPTGPIQLQSGINLHLSEGCHLLFSDNPEDYLPAQFVWWDSLPCLNYHPLIYAHRAKDIALTGKGTIDGNHEAWLDWKFREERASQTLYRANARGIPATERVFATQEAALRPQLVHLLDCERVLLSDYTARRSPFWNHHIALCREVTARGLRLQNPPRTRTRTDSIWMPVSIAWWKIFRPMSAMMPSA